MATAAGPHLGINAVLYRNTGSFGSPVWAACQLIGNCTVSPKWDKGDASVRGNRLKRAAKTQMEITVTPKMRVDYNDTGFAAFWGAANADTVLNVLVLDGPLTTEGAFGYWLDVQVFANIENQDMSVVEYMEFELYPYPTANQQSYVTIGANNAITSTAIGS